jgi:hypothetical protein
MMACLLSINLLNKVDLPTLGRPIIATTLDMILSQAAKLLIDGDSKKLIERSFSQIGREFETIAPFR